MPTLITGGTGFIGQYVTRRLLDEGTGVVLYDVAPNESRIADIVDEVAVVRGDIRDAEALARALRHYDVDTVVHLAAVLTRTARQYPVRGVEINGLGTARLFEFAALAEVDRVVLASSVAAYGFYGPEDTTTVTETTPLRPTNLYGSTKVLGEHLGRVYADDHGLAVTALRFGTVFGPGRESGASSFTSDMVEAPLEGRPVTIPGRNLTVNWLYVKDAARAIRAAVSKGPRGFSAYNVLSELAPTNTAVTAVEERVADANISFEDGPHAGPPWTWPHMDASKAERDLGFTPAYGLDSGVDDYIDELTRN